VKNEPQILPQLQLQHPVVVPRSSIETKLNMGAQLQTFPYPTISKPLLSSNGFWAKSFSQTLPLQQHDRQADKKLNIFGSSV